MWILAGAFAVIACVATATLRYFIVFPRHNSGPAVGELDAKASAMAARLETHVRAVASKPHNLAYPAELERAAVYIETTLREMGHTPLPQRYRVGTALVRNVEVIIEPPIPSSDGPATLVIGAHYDAPDDSPGANDNGTGVACLLELARSLNQLSTNRRLRLVFFVNEEQPYGKTPAMGSYRHAKALKNSGERVEGMLALETLGYFSDTPGSQRFPFPFGLLYSNTGNFVAFVGMPRGRTLVHTLVKAFRSTGQFPAIGGVAPGFIEGIDLSDHWAYDHFEFPACMVTDTAPFRNPYYHQPFDLPHTVDYTNLARVTAALHAMIVSLAAAKP